MRRLLPVFLALAAACGSERAVTAKFHLTTGAARLCVLASGGASADFVQVYGDDATGAPNDGTLTFVAGSVVHDHVTLSARGLRGAAIVERDVLVAPFPSSGTSHETLTLARCRMRPAVATDLAVRPAGRADAVAAGSTLAAADVDGDGRDEALVLGAGGTLVRLDLEPGAGVPSAVATGVPGRLAAILDLDADCALDGLFVGSGGARIVRSLGDAAPAPVVAAATSPVDDGAVGVVLLGAMPDLRLALATPTGVVLAAPRSERAAISLGTVAMTSIAVGDLTGDQRADILATGATATSLWIGTDSGAMAASTLLPAAFTAAGLLVALGDVDGDGDLDVAFADAIGVHIALNAGDGTLTATATRFAATAAVQLVVADLDGDCRDDLSVVDGMGMLRIVRRQTDDSFVDLIPVVANVARIVAADVDADGARELVVLGTDQSVSVVSP